MSILKALALYFAAFLFSSPLWAANILPPGQTTFFDANGNPLSGGTVSFFIPNTTTFKNTYKNSNQTVFNTNPVILDAAGRAIIYGTGTYRQIVRDRNGNLIWDNLTSDGTSGGAGGSSWGGTSGGTANAQTVNASNFSSIDGQQINFIAGLSNTSATTLNPGVGPISILKDTVSGPTALTGSEIIAGNLIELVYSSATGAFHMVSYPINLNAPFGILASSSTTDLGTIASRNVFIGGGTTINSFGFSASTNLPIYNLKFGGGFTIAYNAVSMILPGLESIVTEANDAAVAAYLGGGNWQILSYQRASGLPLKEIPMAAGVFSNLSIATSGTLTYSLTANYISLSNTLQAKLFNSIGLAGNISTSGANGLDSGAVANNTWYSVWVIGTPAGATASLLSTSATTPLMPTGYTYKSRVGWLRTNGSAQFRGSIQKGNRAQWVVSGGEQLQTIVTGVVGSVAVPTYVAQSTAAYAPTTAASIELMLTGLVTSISAAAPNASYGAYNSAGNQPPLMNVCFNDNCQATVASFMLQTAQVFYASDNANNYLKAVGWVDNL